MTETWFDYPDDIGPFDVVAVGAHPDDVEMTCGGTLAKLADDGYRVGIVDLTDGEPTPGSPSPDARIAEAQAAARVLGVDARIILDLPNRRLFDCFEARVELAKALRRLRPRVVIGFGDRTPMASPDHWQAMQITDAGIFYARLSKWDDVFDGLPVHTVTTQLYYRASFEPSYVVPYPGQFITDIGSTLDRKMEAMRCYKTQFPPAKAHVLDKIRAAAELVGAAAGFAAGEQFFAPQSLGTTDLMRMVTQHEPPAD